MGIINYYMILIGIVLSILLIQVAYEIQLLIKLNGKEKCSYCGLPLTNPYKASITFTSFKCKRWWCNLLKFLGYLTKKPNE